LIVGTVAVSRHQQLAGRLQSGQPFEGRPVCREAHMRHGHGVMR